MNRCHEIERSTSIHNQNLGFKIGMCSNVRINRLITSGYKAKPENIPDGEIPMHYRRKP